MCTIQFANCFAKKTCIPKFLIEIYLRRFVIIRRTTPDFKVIFILIVISRAQVIEHRVELTPFLCAYYIIRNIIRDKKNKDLQNMK